jgi:hypothetical protein
MAFQLSPGVNVSEVDLTTVVPAVLTSAGAFAGPFVWGPVNKRISVDSEVTLVNRFGKPDNNTAVSFFSAANFLAYGNNLQVVRAAATTSNNATANTQSAGVQIANEDIFQYSYLNNNNGNAYGSFVARYPGELGNSLNVSVYSSNTTGTFANWTYSTYFNGAPGTSSQAVAAGGSNDEIHIVVVDAGGKFTGSKGTVLETFGYVSKASNAVDPLGNSNYYKNVIFNSSRYVYAVDPINYSNTSTTWGQTLGTTFVGAANTTVSLAGGTDVTTSETNYQNAYQLFSNPEETDISLVVTGGASANVQNYVVNNIVNVRKDCVAFVSPPASFPVINNPGNEATQIASWLSALGIDSSYAVADSGWKYQFDKYNNIYRWTPLNADIAGLCVYTDSVRDPWWSPAGFNRGTVKNVVKLAWNPTKTDRDTLYSAGVNPVISMQGQGTILYGDKTLQSKPSAFDRINVRRLFIVLEKAVARAAKYSLFEFNDDFTRSQFVALVEPFLRDIQGRRGIYDYRVVCDTTNNTQQVIDSNQFVGDIYVKPARSINFIQLNFIAVRTGVDFTEIVGRV